MIRVLILLMLPALCAAQTINVGSKRFTESYILGEILTQTVQHAGEATATHRQGLGNTAIVFSALKSGAIDLYPEYTGTLAFELLGLKSAPDVSELRTMMAAHGFGVSRPLGFNNTYALAMSERRAADLGITRISDLARHARLTLGLSQEFLSRKDGWAALKAAYALQHNPRGLDHGLAYEALAAGQIDAIDVYSTDAKLARYGLRLLADDRGFFPAYEAVVLYRLDLPGRYPRSWAAIQALEGSIAPAQMIAMNAAVEIDGKRFSHVAGDFVKGASGGASQYAAADRSFVAALLAPDLGRLTAQHLLLVLASLVPAIALGIPLGVWSARSPGAAHVIMALVGILQTIPALALLAFLITFMGRIGTAPAIVALFLYALLPIVRNTATGLTDLPRPLKESALALGLPSAARLRRIELPLAATSILAGIKTSAVIGVGTATIAAFIGAGGFGERIVSGLAVNDNVILLAGAVPAAALALLVQGAFEALERWIVPRGLRLKEEGLTPD